MSRAHRAAAAAVDTEKLPRPETPSPVPIRIDVQRRDLPLATAAEPLSPAAEHPPPNTHQQHSHHHDHTDNDSDVSDLSDLGLDESKAKLFRFLQDSRVPVSESQINPHNKGEKLQTSVLQLLKELMPEYWGSVEKASDVKLERVSGAMTNSVYFVTGPDHKLEKECGESHHKVLLRIYGSGADQFISRDREMFWLCKMSEKGVAPKLLGAFANGRFEQFLNSTTLTKEDFREPSTSQQIAQQLYKLHQLIHSSDDADEVESTKESDIWNKMRRWQKMAAKEMAKLKKSQPDRYATMKTAVRDMKGIKAEIAQVEQHLHSTGSPLVFAHNDAQYGNVLRLEKDKSLMVVDYEYSSINYRGYDFANHFCEWAADYHSDTPHKMHFDQFPTRDQQLIFFNAYIDAANNDTENNKDEVEKKQDREEQLAFMYKETNKFTLASHLLWGLWGIMQAGETEIDFDYVAYACERFNQYWKTKEEMLKL